MVRRGIADTPRSALAVLPDRGALLAYDDTITRAELGRGASRWHAVQLSEAHALRAIVDGGMNIEAPDGRQIHLRYRRHIEHADGNWTWVGDDAEPRGGNTAIITFGEKAVFGSIPYRGRLLQIATSGGQAWLVEPGTRSSPTSSEIRNDVYAPVALEKAVDAVDASHSSMRLASASAALGVSVEATSADAIVDLYMGYTAGFAQRLGGTSQAVTRLTYMVDVVNQALTDSNAQGQIRLVGTQQVDYSDGTDNHAALIELTGLQCADRPNTGVCTPVAQPASLLPLIVAREQTHADLVALVRKLEIPENGSCSASWHIGGGQTLIDQSDAAFGFAVVSDSSGEQFPDEGTTCPEETLAHALGHNLGLQHDRVTAQESDDSNHDGDLLDPEEYGRHTYSFGYSADAANGNFHDIMAYAAAGQEAYRIFSNPDIATCGGFACGVANVSDSARTLRETMPIIAGFRVERLPSTVHNDVDGNGRSDVLLQRAGSLAYWIMDGATIKRSRSFAATSDWRVVATGDIDGNGKLDLVWMNSARQLHLWSGDGNVFTSQFVVQMASGYSVVGAGDRNLDGREDLVLFRPGQLVQWWMNGATITRSKVYPVEGGLVATATGDFNTDGLSDVVFRNNEGDLYLWLAKPEGDYTRYKVVRVSSTYGVAATQDINADTRGDLLLSRSGQMVQLLIDGNSLKTRPFTLGAGYAPVATGAFDGVALGDVVLQNATNRSLLMWLGTGLGYTSTALPTPATGYTVVK